MGVASVKSCMRSSWLDRDTVPYLGILCCLLNSNLSTYFRRVIALYALEGLWKYLTLDLRTSLIIARCSTYTLRWHCVSNVPMITFMYECKLVPYVNHLFFRWRLHFNQGMSTSSSPCNLNDVLIVRIRRTWIFVSYEIIKSALDIPTLTNRVLTTWFSHAAPS